MRLLLVEDDHDLAALLGLVLRRAGHEVRVVDRIADVVAGAAPAGADPVDGVVTDGVLLDGTVDDVLAALAAAPATAPLPVVVCALRPDAVAHPAVVGRLHKPVDVRRFAADVEAAIVGGAADHAGAPGDGAAAGAGTEVADAEAAREVVTRERALQELDRRAGLIADHAAAVLVGDAREDERREAERAAHRAVGLAGALGRSELAEFAAACEQLLADTPIDLRAAAQLCALAADLEDGARRRTPAPRPVPRVRASAVRGRVALIDDDVPLTELLTPRLVAAGFEVEAHHNGREALAALTADREPVDVVVLDVDLPGANGLTVLAGLHAAGLLADTRVVLATVHGNDAELARALATGAVTHLPKPFELDRVVDVVSGLVAA